MAIVCVRAIFQAVVVDFSIILYIFKLLRRERRRVLKIMTEIHNLALFYFLLIIGTTLAIFVALTPVEDRSVSQRGSAGLYKAQLFQELVSFFESSQLYSHIRQDDGISSQYNMVRTSLSSNKALNST